MLFAEYTRSDTQYEQYAQERAGVRSLMRAYQCNLHRAWSPQRTRGFVSRFSASWGNVGGVVPKAGDVLEMMYKRNDVLRKAWTQYLPGDYPSVVIASVLEFANPFIVRAHGKEPLVVMTEGLTFFILGMVLSSVLYAHEEHEPQDCLAVMRQVMQSWLENDPDRAPSSNKVLQLSTIDQQTTTVAVGLANSVLTWAFFHELGHFRLGHSGHSISRMGSASEGEVVAEVLSYRHQQELEADAYGMDRYLELLVHETELRQEFEIGQEADHAPIIAFELMNLAYELHPHLDRRKSASHPDPLTRAATLRNHADAQLSVGGRRFYNYWRELLAFVKDGLTSG